MLISSRELKATKDRALTAVRNANVVIIDNEQRLDSFFKTLYIDKVLKDDHWQACADTQFVVVNKSVFDSLKEYLRKPLSAKTSVETRS